MTQIQDKYIDFMIRFIIALNIHKDILSCNSFSTNCDLSKFIMLVECNFVCLLRAILILLYIL
jgi:hypothetical protein